MKKYFYFNFMRLGFIDPSDFDVPRRVRRTLRMNCQFTLQD